MFKFRLNIYLFLLAFSLNFNLALASDTAKEKRWAEQITDSIMTGDVHWLIANKQKVMGIFTPAQTEKVIGGIILVHGMGVHPNWSDIILPLRTELPNYGWASLSIQMPILNNDANLNDYLPLFDEASSRLESAIQFLNTKNIKNIAIVSHSLGSLMSVYYLTQKPSNPIQAFVAIGLSSSKFDDKLNSAKALKKLKLPILDLYGSRDLELVIKSAPARLKAAKKSGNKRYYQTEVIGADHFFARMDETLVSKIKSWLNKNAPGIAIIKQRN